MARPPKPWYWKARDAWCVDLGGKRQILARGKEAKREAQEEFHRLMASLGRRDVVSPSRMTVADLFDAFLDDVSRAIDRGERASSTYEGYVRFLSSAADRFGATRAAELTPHQVHAWAEAKEMGWNPTTRANGITAVKAAYRWGKRRGLIRDDPIRDMEKPTRLKRKAVLSDDQVRQVLEVGKGTAFADFVLALWESGCRPSEVASLTADRVDLTNGVWTVANKTRRKTGEETRKVYLTAVLVELSKRLMEAHPEGLVFRNARGRAWTRNAQACAWSRLRKKLGWGAEATSYAVRHRYGIEGLRRGLDSSELAALMGHRDAKMVDTTYGHWDQQDERLKDAARRVRPPDAAPPSPSASGADAPPGPSPGGAPPRAPGA